MTSRDLLRRWVPALLLVLSHAWAAPIDLLREEQVLTVSSGVQSVAWAPDGRSLAIGYSGKDTVEVWDVARGQALWSVPSRRRPINLSGQEAVFTPDGAFLVVQDFLDTKGGVPRFPGSYGSPEDKAAAADRQRYVIARVWNIAERREVAQIRGPGSVAHGAVLKAMCQAADIPGRLIVLRKAFVALYELPSGKLLREIDASHPFRDRPADVMGYWRMACSPTEGEAVLEGSRITDPHVSGMETTPVAVVDLKVGKVKRVLLSPHGLNGVTYAANGASILAYGATEMTIWGSRGTMAETARIPNPPLWSWMRQQRKRVDPARPPAEAPRGNVGEVKAIPGTSLVLGLSGDVYAWDVASQQMVSVIPVPADVFRIAVDRSGTRVAIAEGNRVHLYRVADQGRK